MLKYLEVEYVKENVSKEARVHLMKTLFLDFRDCDLRIGTFDWGLTDLYFVGITKWVSDLKGFDISIL